MCIYQCYVFGFGRILCSVFFGGYWVCKYGFGGCLLALFMYLFAEHGLFVYVGYTQILITAYFICLTKCMESNRSNLHTINCPQSSTEIAETCHHNLLNLLNVRVYVWSIWVNSLGKSGHASCGNLVTHIKAI